MMRIVAIAADVAMGVILGLFLLAVVSRAWPPAGTRLGGACIVLAAVLVTLYRRPNGSLARRRDPPTG